MARAVVGMPLLAIGFVVVFDGVLLATAWDQLRREARALAAAAADGQDPAAPRDAGVTRGVIGDAPRRVAAVGCPSGAYVVDARAGLPDWLLLAPVVRRVLPGLRARGTACARPGAKPDVSIGPDVSIAPELSK